MANTDKNIIIIPNVGSETDDPTLTFSAANASFGPANISVMASANNSGSLMIASNTANIVTMLVNGNVGIGTSSPTSLLDVNGNVKANIFTGNLTGNVTGAITGNVTGNVTGNLTGNVENVDTLALSTAGNNRVLINNEGVVRVYGDNQSLRPTALYANGIPGLRIDDEAWNRTIEILYVGPNASPTYGANANSSVINVRGNNNPLVFSTDDTQRMILTSTGNVGIGTSTPTSILHTSGSAPIFQRTTTATTAVRNTVNLIAATTGSAADGFGPLVEFALTDAETTSGTLAGIAGIRAGADDVGSLAFLTANTGVNAEQMRLTSTGLGIGTTAPISKLEVRDGFIIAGTDVSTLGTKILGGYYSNGQLTTLGSDYSSGGPVLGYGVWPSTSATGAFISATGISATRGAYLIAGANHIWYGGGAQTVAIGSAVTTSTLMTLTSSGDLGIGVTNPGQKLEVNGVIRARGDIVAVTATSDRIHLLPQTAGGGGIIATADNTFSAYTPMTLDGSLFVWRPGGTERMRFNGSGNLGVGTASPGYRIHIAYDQPTALGVYRDLDVTSAGAAGTYIDLGARSSTTFTPGARITGVLDNPATTGYMVFETRSGGVVAERMRITSGGLVGIGKTPGTGILLDVNGAGTFLSNASNTSGLNLIATAGYVSNIRIFRSGYADWFIGSPNNSDYLYVSVTDGAHGSPTLTMPSQGGLIIGSGAIATTATNGFLYVPGCAGAPTGTPSSFTGRVPIVVDTTNHKLYFYSGGQWRDAGP